MENLPNVEKVAPVSGLATIFAERLQKSHILFFQITII
jgi:hypothetical protein